MLAQMCMFTNALIEITHCMTYIKNTLELAMYVAAHRVQSLAHSCVHVGKAWMPDSCVLQRSIDRSKNKQSPETR